MARVFLLYGPLSGRGKASNAVKVVRGLIKKEGHAVVDVTGGSAEESLVNAKSAVADGAERLIVVGGDGTLSIAVQAVAGSETVLGVVPAGTGNDFARALGLKDKSIGQATVTALNNDRRIDAIKTQDRFIASVITGGFSAEVNNRAEQMRFPKGPSRYTLATLIKAVNLKYQPLTFTVDGTRHDYKTTLWAVANTYSFGGGMLICPDANPQDGQIDLTVIADVSRPTLLRLLPTVFQGKHVRHPKVHTLRGTTIEITQQTPSPVTTQILGEGEPIGHLPVTMTVAKDALRIAAP